MRAPVGLNLDTKQSYPPPPYVAWNGLPASGKSVECVKPETYKLPDESVAIPWSPWSSRLPPKYVEKISPVPVGFSLAMNASAPLKSDGRVTGPALTGWNAFAVGKFVEKVRSE